MISPDIRAYAVTTFDRSNLMRHVQAGVRKALTRDAAYVMRIAKNSIKKPRRLSLAEMTPRQRKAHARRLREARRRGEPRPLRPFATAKRDRPPFDRTGWLKYLIRFGYDRSAERMLIGPMIARTGTAAQLEHGGSARLKNSAGKKVTMHFAGNPFMQPALTAAAPKLAEPFRDCIRP